MPPRDCHGSCAERCHTYIHTLGVFDYESDSPGLPGALHAQRSLGEGITSGSALLSGTDNRRHPRTHDDVSHSVTATRYTNLCTTTAALRSSMCITPFRGVVEKLWKGCGMGRNNREVQLLKGSRGEYVITVAMRLDQQEQHPLGTISCFAVPL